MKINVNYLIQGFRLENSKMETEEGIKKYQQSYFKKIFWEIYQTSAQRLIVFSAQFLKIQTTKTQLSWRWLNKSREHHILALQRDTKNNHYIYWFKSLQYVKLKSRMQGFPGGAVVESLPANAGNTGSSPGLGGSHMPRSN